LFLKERGSWGLDDSSVSALINSWFIWYVESNGEMICGSGHDQFKGPDPTVAWMKITRIPTG
jgi:hypothetical protein